jgi:aromatic ring-opening dioxygenase LigB subunit
MITFGAIAPHGDVEDIPELLAGMQELGRRCTSDTAVVVTPHNVHVEGHFAVGTAAHVGEHAIDRDLADAIVEHARADRLPILRVSYGGNDPAQAELPLDWGTEVPLNFVKAKQVVVVTPARDRPLAEHVRLGAAIAKAAGGRDVALIASADHGHAHDPEGPYGFHPAAERYDRRFLELLKGEPLDFRPLVDLVDDAKADSLWQLLVLQGAVGGRAELLAYAVRSYYGMAVAIVA